MSIDLNWSLLNDFNEKIKDLLNEQIQSIELPDFLANLQINSISLGTKAPYIAIKHISNPFEEFYNELDKSYSRKEEDIQFLVELKYDGDIMIEIQVELLMNYPSQEFITLPITLRIVEISIHSLIILAYLDKQAFISFLCDLDDGTVDERSNTITSEDGTINMSKLQEHRHKSNNNNISRIDIVKDLKIENEIGDADGSILRNVGKVEKFLVEMLRNLLRDEVAWPGWINLDFNEEDEEEEEEEEGEEGD
ncbi:hypothetical protein WICMUC_004332 [Wickerhamomyces mucosus]|uniref:Mitochondrial distribution and morphology protein 12 n=1 Tax=Wickerhamomyces mucosus TaxID=1378264 RepID=A0A9P8PIP9_9ASCO|nr:hypothetical protein WICMUC_004332 [Wickerhamomyces mucosus]